MSLLQEKKNSSIKKIKHNGRSIYKSQELSEAFNNHFSTIGPKLANAIYFNESGPSPLDYIEGTSERFELRNTNVSKVHSLLSKLCKSKATGLDKVERIACDQLYMIILLNMA